MFLELGLLGAIVASSIACVRSSGPRWFCVVNVVIAVLLISVGALVGAVSKEPVGFGLVAVGALPLTSGGVRWGMLARIGALLGGLIAIVLAAWWAWSGGVVTVDAAISRDPSSIAVLREARAMHWTFATGIAFGCAAVAAWSWIGRRTAT